MASQNKTQNQPKVSLQYLAGVDALGGIATSLGALANTYFQSSAAKTVARYQAEIEAINASMAERSAHMALQRSAWNIGQISLRASAIRARQKGNAAARGVAIGVGSSAELLASTDIMKEMDVNQEYVNGYREAWSIRTQGRQHTMNSIAYQGTASSISPIGNSMLVGAKGLLSTYKNYRKETS